MPINGQIKEKEVQLIGAEGEKIGVVPIEKALEKALKEKNQEISNLSKLLENFTQTISTLTDRIADFKITSYTLNGTNYIIPAHESKITGTVIPPTDLTEEVIHDFTFTVEWYDGKNNVYDNFEDVEAIKQGLPATIPITLSVTQILDTTT